MEPVSSAEASSRGSDASDAGMTRASRRGRDRGRRRRRTSIVTAVLIVLVLLIAAAAWVLIRGMLARDELTGATPAADRLKTAVLDGDPAAIEGSVAELQRRTESAESLTSDSIWRAAEILPVAGANLAAVRETASALASLSRDGLPAAEQLATTIDPAALAPRDGRIDLQLLTDASPALHRLSEALDAAEVRVSAVDAAPLVPQVGDAVRQLQALVGETASTVEALDGAASLIPPLLGADGPRSYLLLSLNNAELRATGGIAGAAAVVTADDGRISLGATASSGDFGRFDPPALPLTEAESKLYTDRLGIFIQDVNFTPDFARTGALAQAMWQQRTGQVVDGVVAVDPVLLSYLLTATGPIDVAGTTIDEDNAVDVLLSEVYAKYSEPADQDAFFAATTATVFERVSAGDIDARRFLDALVRGADEERVHAWSTRADEQAQLAATTLGSALPIASPERTPVGVYFNDSTQGKMDYYLGGAMSVGSVECRGDDRPYFEVTVRLGSSAPADAATSLPGYVTGDGRFGASRGSIRTNVFVYAPADGEFFSARIAGQERAFTTAQDGAWSVAGLTVDLAPGEVKDVVFTFLGAVDAPQAVTLQHTPLVGEVPVDTDAGMRCPADGEGIDA
jgi:hypothetical protein